MFLQTKSQNFVLLKKKKKKKPDDGQTSRGILLSGLQIFRRVKLKEQDHSYQHLSCSSPSLQLQNSHVVKKGNSEERSKKRELLMLIDSTSKDEVVDVDWLNWSLHMMLLLLVSASTSSKVKRGLPD